MEVIIKGTKEEIKELLAEIRRRDKEYITVPNYVYPTYTPYITKPYIITGETTAHSAFGERKEE